MKAWTNFIKQKRINDQVKIALIINNLEGGGAERVVSTLSNHLSDELDHEVRIFVLGGKPAYPLSDKVRVLTLSTGKLCAGPGKLLALPLLALELGLRLRKYRPDAVMSFLVRCNLMLILARPLIPHLRINISERCATNQAYSKGVSSKIMKMLVKLLYPKADGIVAISGGVKESLIPFGVSADKIRVIYNPQNIREITKLASSGFRTQTNETFTIVMAGRLVEQKDYPTMLQALKKLKQWGLKPNLIVLGEGSDREPLAKLSQELGVADQIEWRGWIPNAYEVMASTDLFVFSSKFEGFGNVLVEAMACGLPVISTDCPSGPSEILEGGRFGTLVPVGDSETLALAIRELMTNPKIREEFVQKSLERAPQFDVPIIAREYLEVLSEGIR